MAWENAEPHVDNWGNPPAANFSATAASANEFGFDSGDARNQDAGGFGDFGGFGDATGGVASRGCFNCGQEGHMKSECPQPPKSRACFNCGEEGHSKAECTNPAAAREFTGTCRLCEQQGHRASDCPSKPPTVCKNCQEEGHDVVECAKPRKIDRSHVPDLSGERAWELMMAAVDEREIVDVKEAVEMYVKSCPDVTYLQLEDAFRNMKLSIYLIAIKKELGPTYVNMDLQGNLGKTYSVTWRWSPQPRAPKEKDGWPSSPEENRTRLADAGEPVDCLMQICRNCDQLGHVQRNCPEDKMEKQATVVKCYNCEETGHRIRDCPNPRPDKSACRNCQQSGHTSKECPEPRSAEGIECKKCQQMGHFSRDCPQGGGGARACFNCGQEGHSKNDCTNERVLTCRNCDEQGHLSKECPKPRDYSRIKCSNCEKMGHTKVRCKEPPKVEEGQGGADGFGNGAGDFGAATGGDNFGNQYGGGGNDGW